MFNYLDAAYPSNLGTPHPSLRAKRIIADHMRTAAFMVADGVIPSNSDRGYVLRRLLRRAIRYAIVLNLQSGQLGELAKIVQKIYQEVYPEIAAKEGEFKFRLKSAAGRI